MLLYSNKTQVAYAAATWVFGGDSILSGIEKTEISKAFNGTRSPWHLEPNDENAKWVHSLCSNGKMNLKSILDGVNIDFHFTLQEKFQLFWCVCVPMNAMNQGGNSKDGWERAHRLREALEINEEDYNNWANQR